MKNSVLLWSILIGIIVVGFVAYAMMSLRTTPDDIRPGTGKACTLEAKLCPDGSAVGRTGPNCEFSPCPGGKPVTPDPIPLPSGY